MINVLENNDLANYLPHTLLLLDKHWHVIGFNPAAQHLFPNIQKTELKNIIPEIDIEKLNENPIEIRLATNPKKYFSIKLIKHKNGQRILLLEDITHLHHLEKMRQDFVANASHELRTPLTVNQGYLEILLDKFQNDNTYKKIFLQMHQQSIRMTRIVEDLLLLSRLEIEAPNSKQFKKINIETLLHEIVKDAIALSGEKKHHIDLEVKKNLNIYGLENEIHSAIANIVFNAVHYTPAQGKIKIRWFSEKQFACLSISDNGIGIAAEHIPRLTERFYRVDKDRSRSSGGTGLGLAIVKHILMRHHAQLEIQSTLGAGSTFICRFALNKN